MIDMIKLNDELRVTKRMNDGWMANKVQLMKRGEGKELHRTDKAMNDEQSDGKVIML